MDTVDSLNYENCVKNKAFPVSGLDYKPKPDIDIEQENKNSIIKTEHYILNAFNIIAQIVDAVIEFENDINYLYNDINIHALDRTFIERYNKAITFLFNHIQSYITSPIVFGVNTVVYPIY